MPPQENYFAGDEVAARYHRVRPSFHAQVAERIRRFVEVGAGAGRFVHALDVGCGSGHSSLALAEIAGQVTAIDPSPSMLKHAPERRNIRYRLASAEQLDQLDFADGAFDLVSAASALHWFDQDRFYPQCRRVLSAAGLLAVYNDHFTSHMQDVPACKHWMRTRFARQFPHPKRGMRDIDESQAARYGFSVAHRCSFNHLVRFSREQLIAYLLTRSNTLAVLCRPGQNLRSVTGWLDGELATIVPDGCIGSFVFKCNLWLLRPE